MSRFLRVAVILLLASCGGGNYKQPRNLDDACALGRERPEYMRAMQRTERRWNVPVPVQMAMIHQESKFVGDARTPFRYVLGVIPMGRQSSAYGYAQAIDGTWEDYQESGGGGRAKRDRIEDATDFMGWYMNQTVEKAGVPLTDARNQYLAYHEGHAGYLRGSHNAKAWLLRVADEVATRANMYNLQLIACRR
ncbi:MAG: lytic transglycosylase [Paracoccaceae bacterium]|nr:lytic transglycosylase [Paracoccaceae bacterium]